MPEEKALIDTTDDEIHAALRSEHHRNVVPSVAFLHEELNRRASGARRKGERETVTLGDPHRLPFRRGECLGRPVPGREPEWIGAGVVGQCES